MQAWERTAAMTEPLSAETRDKLAAVSTATLTTQLFKRGLRNVFIQGVSRLTAAHDHSMVGPAFTLRYIPAREDIDSLDVFQDYDHPQRKAIETCPEGHVLVMDCRSDASAASRSEEHTSELQSLMRISYAVFCLK